MFPIRTEQTRSRRGSSERREDSAYGTSISSQDQDRSDAKESRRSSSRDPPPPPSSFPKSYSTYRRPGSIRRDDRSDSDRRIVREKSLPPRPRGADMSSQADEDFIYGQPGVKRQYRPPSSSGDNRSSQCDDQSTHKPHTSREPYQAFDTWDGDRNNQSNGEHIYERLNPGEGPNPFQRGGHQETPHYEHFHNNDTSAPRAPEHEPGLSRRDREFAEEMGKGIGNAIKLIAYRPTQVHALSVTVVPQKMKWMIKTERLCGFCHDWIGQARFWRCQKWNCKHNICNLCKNTQRSCLHTKGHTLMRI